MQTSRLIVWGQYVYIDSRAYKDVVVDASAQSYSQASTFSTWADS
jgi:hypothetical protein